MVKEQNRKTAEQKEWEKDYPNGKAMFSWAIYDYEIWEIEPPECILKNPGKTEGELLTEEEIKTWCIDSIQSLVVLKWKDEEVYKRVYKDFILDLKHLLFLDKIPFELLEFALDEKNFE
jgi:hypothetical protein